MQPNTIISLRDVFFNPKHNNKTKHKTSPGCFAQKEMKFHYVVQWDFKTIFVWKRAILETGYEPAVLNQKIAQSALN